MNSFWIFIAALQVAFGVDPQFDDHWAKFKENHGKNYETPEEEEQRREHFEKHVKNVAVHNAKYDMGLESYKMSVNHEHADKPFEEFRKTMLGAMPPTFFDGRNRTDFSKVPSARAVTLVDWTKGTSRVTPVKNQGSCGSCWTFSTTAALEGQWYTCKKQIKELSMQYLVDCVTKDDGAYGCDGGWPYSAMDFVRKNGGVPTLADYPYKGNDKGPCPARKIMVMPTLGREQIGPEGDETAVANALATKGPLSIAVEVDDKMANYRSGIFSSTTCNNDVNHAVTLVGSGTENGQDYWLIKNSWGTSWGEKGFIRIKRNAGNMCLVASFAAYPIPDCSKVK